MLLAGNYIKGALFQGPGRLNVIKCNLPSVPLWGQPVPLPLSFLLHSQNQIQNKTPTTRNSSETVTPITSKVFDDYSSKSADPQSVLTSRWCAATAGKRGTQRFMQSASNYVMQSLFDEVSVEAGTLNPSEGTANRVTHHVTLLAALRFHSSRKPPTPNGHIPPANDAHADNTSNLKYVRGKKRWKLTRKYPFPSRPACGFYKGSYWPRMEESGMHTSLFLRCFHQLKQLDIQAHLQMAHGNVASLPWSRSWPCAPHPGSCVPQAPTCARERALTFEDRDYIYSISVCRTEGE